MRTAAPSPTVATILLAAIAGFLFLSIAPARLYVEQRTELAELSRRATELAAVNERMAARADRLRDPAFLEGLARRCLGMVRPGEVAFVVVPEEGAPAAPPEC